MKKKWIILAWIVLLMSVASSYAPRAYAAEEVNAKSHGSIVLKKGKSGTKPPTDGGGNQGGGSGGSTGGGNTGNTSGGKTFLPQLGEMAKGISTVMGAALVAFMIFIFWKRRKDEEEQAERKR